jgi:hypothetical protein
MHSIRYRKFLILFLAMAIILACSPFAAATPQPAATLNALYTSAAQTLEALSTQAVVTLTAVSPSPTSALSLPTASPIVLATFTPVPPLSTVVSRCDAAEFVSDVTFPDGTFVSRGSTFTKIWRIKNVGTCNWTTSYALVYDSGDRFDAPNAVSLLTSVAPGQTIDVAVNLTAPSREGHYRGYWKLRNGSGMLFGVGASAISPFYVDINVSGYTVLAYDFIANVCEANWENNSRNLPCPGTDGDNRGFVLALNSPNLEDGRSQGKALLTFPRRADEGLISGQYPGFRIQSGDRFQAVISCQHRANDCDVTFRLQYQIGNGAIRTLAQWREVYEGEFYSINMDLSALDGERVKFILSVTANGDPHEDFALWVNPRITRQSSQPPTATSTAGPSPTATATPTSTLTPTSTPTATATVTPTP